MYYAYSKTRKWTVERLAMVVKQYFHLCMSFPYLSFFYYEDLYYVLRIISMNLHSSFTKPEEIF